MNVHDDQHYFCAADAVSTMHSDKLIKKLFMATILLRTGIMKMQGCPSQHVTGGILFFSLMLELRVTRARRSLPCFASVSASSGKRMS